MPRKAKPKPEPEPQPKPKPARLKKQVTFTLDPDALADLDWIAANVPGVDSRSAAVRAAAAHYRKALEASE